MEEMFTLFPHESALVMQRGIEMGIGCSSMLVMHCAALVTQSWASETILDLVLRSLCLARIMCAVPRPYFWFKTRRLFMDARAQPTPQLVTRRLLNIYANPPGLERVLLLFYYGWLACVTSIVCFARTEVEYTAFTNSLWRHCLLNFVSIMLHKLICVLLFYYLMQADFDRGIPPGTLEKYTCLVQFAADSTNIREKLGGEDMECSICFGAYEAGESLRKLRCGHHFHQRCVDVWLLRHQNRCPLCLAVVGQK